MSTEKNNVITKFSLTFVKRWRISLLLLIGILAIGLFTYTNVLKREGMPAINSPFGMVTVPYFINDQAAIDKNITTPIENVITDIPEVDQVYSTTSDNYVTFQIMFDQDQTSESGIKLVKEKIGEMTNLPENAKPEYQTYDFGKIDNEHDLLFTVSAKDKSYKELQSTAEIVVEALRKNSNISKADISDVYTIETNPITGAKVENRKKISRFGEKVDGKLTFSNAIYIGVSKKNPDTGAMEFSDIVRKETDKVLKKDELKGYDITYSVGDPSISLKEEIGSLQTNAMEALIIVLIVIFIVINWRASLVTVIFIPAVFAATFIGFQLIGYSINSITLFGLVLVLGLFVDDAIVVVEAIDAQKQKGLTGINAIQRAISKVGIADTLGTFTTMLVFVPIALITGVFGEFVRAMPVTVILALGLSLVIALSIIPFLSSLIIKDRDEGKSKSVFAKIDHLLHIPGVKFNELGVYVGKFVNLYLSKKRYTLAVFAVSIIAIFIGLMMAGKTPFEIFPAPTDTNEIGIELTYTDGTPIDQKEVMAKQVETALNSKYADQVEYVSYFEYGMEGTWMYVELRDMKDRDITSKTIVDDLNKDFAGYTAFKASASQIGVGPGSTDYQYQMQVYGDDTKTLTAATTDITNFLKTVEISKNVKVEDVIVMNTKDVAKIDGRRYFLVMAKITKSKNSSGDLQILTNKVKDHYNESKITSLGLSEDALGYDLGFESQMADSMSSLYMGLMIIMIVMYAILVMRFNSFTKPLLVFLGIPFTFPLLFSGLYLTDNKFSFFVIIGITALIGIIANNSIMLLDFAQMRMEEEGKGPKDAIVGAIKRRFRPLVATTVITVTGLLPLALDDPFWSPLALTIIFGLISSTTLLIFAFPAYYYGLEKVTNLCTRQIKKLVR